MNSRTNIITMHKIFSLVLLIQFFFLEFGHASKHQNVIAYLPEYRFYSREIESSISCCLTDLILFSISIQNNGMVDDHWLPIPEIKRFRAAADAVQDRIVTFFFVFVIVAPFQIDDR